MAQVIQDSQKMKFLLTVGVLLLVQYTAVACSVPVFRYALERWERDFYQVLVVKNGELTEEEADLALKLQSLTVNNGGSMNMSLSIINLKDNEKLSEVSSADSALKTLDTEVPQLVLLSPKAMKMNKVLWSDIYSQKSVSQLVKSASNMDAINKVLKGVSTVFFFLDSGNVAKDNAAFSLLQECKDKLKNTLTIPAGIIDVTGEVSGSEDAAELKDLDPSNQLESGIPLTIAFETIRISKEYDDPVLRSILMGIENDLYEYKNEPMIFCFFGRGRILPPLIGEGINKANITEAAQYLCGACSCEIKAQNPGMDYLTNFDWQSFIEGNSVTDDKSLPALTGIGDIIISGGGSNSVLPESSEERLEAQNKVSEKEYSNTNKLPIFLISSVIGLLLISSFVIIKR